MRPKSKADLHVVPTPDAAPPIDIYQAIRDKCRSINWERVHIDGGRRPPLDLPLRRGPDRVLGHGVRVERKCP